MKTVLSLFIFILSFVSHQAVAHGGDEHDHISDDKALGIARMVAQDLSKRDVGLPFGKLPKTWGRIWQKNVSIHASGKGFFVVSVLNEEEEKTLYVLMSDKGKVYDANFTGVFKGLNDGGKKSDAEAHHDHGDHEGHDHHNH